MIDFCDGLHVRLPELSCPTRGGRYITLMYCNKNTAATRYGEKRLIGIYYCFVGKSNLPFLLQFGLFFSPALSAAGVKIFVSRSLLLAYSLALSAPSLRTNDGNQCVLSQQSSFFFFLYTQTALVFVSAKPAPAPPHFFFWNNNT